jgi:hypothetical protein
MVHEIDYCPAMHASRTPAPASHAESWRADAPLLESSDAAAWFSPRGMPLDAEKLADPTLTAFPASESGAMVVVGAGRDWRDAGGRPSLTSEAE